MKQIERLNLSKIWVVSIISLVAFIVGFFLRGNSDFTIPIAMLIGALLLYVTIKIDGPYYEEYKNKSKMLALIGVFGVSAIFVGVINVIVYIFDLVPINIVIKRGIISILIGFILVGISYFSFKTKKKD